MKKILNFWNFPSTLEKFLQHRPWTILVLFLERSEFRSRVLIFINRFMYEPDKTQTLKSLSCVRRRTIQSGRNSSSQTKRRPCTRISWMKIFPKSQSFVNESKTKLSSLSFVCFNAKMKFMFAETKRLIHCKWFYKNSMSRLVMSEQTSWRIFVLN